MSSGTGNNASANQGLTAVTSTTNNTANSNIVHNSAAAGSSAADLSSNSAAQSQTGSSKDRHSSSSSTAGDVSAVGKADNTASDSSETSTTATPDKVSRLTLASCVMTIQMAFHHAFSLLSKVCLDVSQRISTQLFSRCCNIDHRGLKL